MRRTTPSASTTAPKNNGVHGLRPSLPGLAPAPGFLPMVHTLSNGRATVASGTKILDDTVMNLQTAAAQNLSVW